MSQFIITIPDDRKRFFRELLRNLPWAEVEPVKPKPAKKPRTPEQQEWVDDLKQSLREAEAAMRGEIKLPTLAEHLAELRALRQQTPEPTNAD